MKKNIIIITDYAAPYEGNFIASMKELERVARNKNYNIKFLFSNRTANINWVKKMSLEYNADFFSENIISVIEMIKKSIDKKSENIIYSHFARHKTQFAIKLFKMLHRKIKLVQHFHNHCKIPDKFPKKQFMSFAYKLYEGDLNIGCSESVMNSMPYSKKKITFIDNAIDFNRLDENAISNIVKKSDDEVIVLMFGFDYYRKGVDIAINAIKDIANEKKIILAISLATNKEKIENIIKSQFEQKIPNWIRLLPPSENVSEYYNMADIFLSAAREEGLCYSNIEAVYCGVKCIFSNLEEQPLDIPNIVSFESENVKDLKSKIVGIIENDELNNKSKKMESKEFVKEKYNISKWANEIMNKLDKM